MSDAEIPEESGRTVAKKFVYCLELAQQKFVLPVPKTQELAPVASAFRSNVASVCQMMVLPAAVGDMAFELRRSLDIAELDLTGELSTPPSTGNEIYSQASDVVRRRIERDWTLPANDWQKLIHERLKWGAVPLGWVSGTRQGSHGLDALFSSFVVGSWTAVETMIGDLWEATLNARPDGLVGLQGNPKRLVGKKWKDQTAPPEPDHLDDETAETDEIPKKNANAPGSDRSPISISLNDLVAHRLDIRNKMGTILARTRYNFSVLDNARLAYGEAFWKNSGKIDTAIMDRSFDKLNHVRNLLVHKAGFADQKYLDSAKSMQLPLAEVGLKIPLDGETAVKLVRPAFLAGSELVGAVDAWLETRKAKLARRNGD